MVKVIMVNSEIISDFVDVLNQRVFVEGQNSKLNQGTIPQSQMRSVLVAIQVGFTVRKR